MSNDSIHPQEVWDAGYQALKFESVPGTDHVRQWLEQWVPTTKQASCLEIGCFPGRYLAFFGERGFELNGVDLTPRTDPDMRDWLSSRGYRVGKIVKGDFFSFEEPRGFDIVYSNGFLEHFENWKPVLEKHANLVKPGGTLLIATPNFRGGFQRFFHSWVDRQNFEFHHLPAMSPHGWSKVVEELGFEVLYQGYFNRFDFWVGTQTRSLTQKLVFWGLRASIPGLRWILPRNSEFSSPYCGLVARRPK